MILSSTFVIEMKGKDILIAQGCSTYLYSKPRKQTTGKSQERNKDRQQSGEFGMGHATGEYATQLLHSLK